MEGKTGVIPFEAAKVENPARLRFEIGDDVLILHVKHDARRQHLAPMHSQFFNGPIEATKLAEVV